MFDQGEWLAEARDAMADYVDLRDQIDELEALAAETLARVIDMYRWPEDVPEPEMKDAYRTSHVGAGVFGEDLTSELAVALRTSLASANSLVGETDRLMRRLPQCFSKVTSGAAPLWQARKVAQECSKLTVDAHQQIDETVAPALGALGPARLLKLVEAALQVADPEGARFRIDQTPDRYVSIRGDRDDPMSSRLSARIDKADAIHLDAIVQLLADKLGVDGDTGTQDERRARGLGVLANPAATVKVLCHPGEDGALEAAFTPRTQVYVHMFAGALDDPDAITRIEGVGPLLAGQVARITGATRVKITPVIHLGGDSIGVDQYEIPAKIRRQVLLRQPFDVFPYSSIESRHLDLDHTVPYVNGIPDQTRPANLGPLSRRAHRVKTHAGWVLKQPSPGVYLWQTGAGQQIQVDNTGTHPVHRRL